MTYVPVVHRSIYRPDEYFKKHLHSVQAGSDKFAANYNLITIRRMTEYGYIYNNTPDDLVYMTGIQEMAPSIFRLESRLYLDPKYRKRIWSSPDDYEAVQYQYQFINADMIFKSREVCNAAGLTLCQKHNSFFDDWQLYDSQIELKYKNNWQWIFFKNIIGDTYENIQKLVHKV